MRPIRIVAVVLVSLSAFAQTKGRVVEQVPVEVVERRCPRVITYQGGVADNFAPGIDPAYPSLALDAYLHTSTQPIVQYDDASNCDHWFGDSFKIDECVVCCGICTAQLEVTYRSCGSALDCNDSIVVGQAPFNAGGGPGYVIFSGYLDANPCVSGGGGGGVGPVDVPSTDRASSAAMAMAAGRATATPQPVTRTINLDPRKVMELLCEKKVRFLDVMIQDDRIVDSMRLIISRP